MSQLAVIGTILVQPGARTEVLKALQAHRERSLRDEPGTLAFEVLVPVDDANKLMVYELYESQAAFQAHMKGASMAVIQSEVGSKVTSLTGVPCTPAGG